MFYSTHALSVVVARRIAAAHRSTTRFDMIDKATREAGANAMHRIMVGQRAPKICIRANS